MVGDVPPDESGDDADAALPQVPIFLPCRFIGHLHAQTSVVASSDSAARPK